MTDAQEQKKRKFSSDEEEEQEDAQKCLPQIAEEDVPKILEPLTQQELLEVAKYASTKHADVLEQVRKIADRDVSRRKIFVRGLGYSATKEQVNEVFGSFGEIEETNVPADKTSGKSKGYAFVTYKHVDSALCALKLPNKTVDGKTVACNFASEGPKQQATQNQQSQTQFQFPQSFFPGTLNPGAANPNPNALVASSDASKVTDSDVSRRKIYIKGLGHDTTKEAIIEVFGKSGEIEETNLPIDKTTGKNKGYAFVTYKTVDSAINALREPSKMIDGCKTYCNLAVVGSRQTLYTEQLQQLQQQQLQQQQQLLQQQQQQLQQSLAVTANPLQPNIGYPFPQSNVTGLSAGYMGTGALTGLPGAFNSTALATAAFGNYNLTDTTALSSLPRDTSPAISLPYHSAAGTDVGKDLLLQGLTSRLDSVSSLYGGQAYGGGVASLYGTNASRFLPG
eukprot:TRINITY_DN2738_c0_g1_i1.p1 TRINITY_DN2738_c0_g1~~TRINITY_DN2738_c0_g1_i1.p1  ORF type:complete len:451 (-),score=86.72 TRINITY_DN2738_c0_g1_i1:403-1755(-)